MASVYLVKNEDNGEYGIRCGTGEKLMATVRDDIGVVLIENKNLAILKSIQIPDSLLFDLMSATQTYHVMSNWRGQINAIINSEK